MEGSDRKEHSQKSDGCIYSGPWVYYYSKLGNFEILFFPDWRTAGDRVQATRRSTAPWPAQPGGSCRSWQHRRQCAGSLPVIPASPDKLIFRSMDH
jgi:hypothetical protein